MLRLFRLAVLLALLIYVPCLAQTSNVAGIALASTAQTAASVVSADIQNPYWRGGIFVVNVSAYTSGTYTVTVQGQDVLTGAYYTILASAALGATGTTVMRVYPGITVAANLSVAEPLPRVFRVTLTGASTPVATLSVSYTLVQ